MLFLEQATRKPRQTAGGWAFLVLLGLLAWPVIAAEPPFTGRELTRFLAESVPFLEWVQRNHLESMLPHILEKPTAVVDFPKAVHFLRERHWDPRRFAYIFNHVLIAYKRLGMGRAPKQLLRRIEQTKTSILTKAARSGSEKAHTLAIATEAERGVRKISKAFAALPPQEVSLMWLHRQELQRALKGRLPLTKRLLPNPARKP